MRRRIGPVAESSWTPNIRSNRVPYAHSLGGTRHVFPDLRTLLARATPHRSGDALAGLAAASAAERVAAQMVLADLPLSVLLA